MVATNISIDSVRQLMEEKTLEIKEVPSILGGSAITMFFNDDEYFIHKSVVEKYKLVNGMEISIDLAGLIKNESEKCKEADFPSNHPNHLRHGGSLFFPQRIREGVDFPITD